MSENQPFIINSPDNFDLMEGLFDYLDVNTVRSFDLNSSINNDDQLVENGTTKLYADLRAVETNPDDQFMVLLHSISNETKEFEISLSENESSFHSYKSSSTSPSSQISDIDDNEPFNPKEWIISDSVSGRKRAPKLYEFLHLLLNHQRYISYASWLNKDEGIFKIHKPIQVASLWKKVKVRRTGGSMDYDKFARGIRYYYKSRLTIKTYTRHTYCFAQV
jgi:hypothetical protein